MRVTPIVTTFFKGQESLSFMTPEHSTLYHRLVAGSTSSLETLAYAKRWLEDCNADHVQCHARRDEGWYPTRVLDVQCALFLPADRIRLVETGKSAVSGPYITLSHRWPLSFQASIILRPATYDRFCRGVPLSSLPQVVQDAVIICRGLAIRYLWVDCMCIVQDDTDLVDWRNEAVLMERVYSNSYLNLSALAAESTEHSLFRTRDVSTLEGRITTSGYFDNKGHYHLQGEARQYRALDCELWAQVHDADLNKWAWVLQERLLAPRILHFGHEQIFWECCERNAAEVCPDGLPREIWHEKRFKNFGPHQELSRTRLEPYWIWDRIVRKYTTCGLKVSADKLVAISGLARYVGGLVKDEYIAGIWRSQPSTQLFWHGHGVLINEEIGRPLTRPACYRAPTLSWAALDGSIVFHDPRTEHASDLVRILDARLDYATKGDTFGAVLGGHLVLCCILQRLSFRNLALAEHAYSTGTLVINGRYLLEHGPHSLEIPSRVYLDDYAEYSDLRRREDLYCIPAFPFDYPNDMHLEQLHLLLQFVDGTQGTFRRVGLASTLFEGYPDTRELMRGRVVRPGAVSDGDWQKWDGAEQGAKVLRQHCPESRHYPCTAFDGERHIIKLI